VRDVEVRPGINAVELRFEGGTRVDGRVVDEAGAPVPGALVRLAERGRHWTGPETRSDARGTFELPGVLDGDYELWVEAEGFASAAGRRRVSVAGEPVRDLEVRLGRGAVVHGQILGLAPGEHARVTVRADGAPGGGPRASAVDFEGHYRLEHVPAGDQQIVAQFSDSGRSVGERVSVTGADDVKLDLRFAPGLVLSGRARRGGEALAGATVIVEGLDRDRTGWGQTDEHGAFRIPGLEAGGYAVRLREWHSGLAHDLRVDLATDRRIEIDVPQGRIAGRITDSAERGPLAGVSLVLEGLDAPLAGRLPTHTATSDLEGRFSIDDLGDGTFRLSATRKGYAATVRTVVVQQGRGEEQLQIALDPTEGLTLEVRAASGAPPSEVSLAVLDPAGGPLVGGQYATGENGRVRLTSVPAGTWQIVVGAAGAATETVEVVAPGAAVPLLLGPATALRVRVPALSGTGRLATVRLTDAAGRPFRALGWNGQVQQEWRMGNGQLELGELPAGAWSVRVVADRGQSWSGMQTTVPGGAVELVLE
jgi:hypothetical protein